MRILILFDPAVWMLLPVGVWVLADSVMLTFMYSIGL